MGAPGAARRPAPQDTTQPCLREARRSGRSAAPSAGVGRTPRAELCPLELERVSNTAATALRKGPAEPLAARRARRTACALALAAADLLAAGLAVAAAVGLRTWLRGAPMYPTGVEGAVAVWLLLRLFRGLYPGEGLSGPEELRASTMTTVSAGLVHVAVLFALQLRESRLVALSAWVLLALLCWGLRGAAKKVLLRLGLYGQPVVVVGGGQVLDRLVHELVRRPDLGLRPVAVFCDDREVGARLDGVPVLGPTSLALDSVAPPQVDHAVVALSHVHADRAVATAHGLLRRYRTVTYLPASYGLAQLWVRPQAVGPYLTLRVQNNLADPVNALLKRCLDLALGVPLLVLAAPVVLLCALAVRAVDPGPAFYAQDREGQGGRRIRVWKVRTMVRDAEARLQDLLHRDPSAREEWERHMKLRRDPRVLPVVGGLMRRLSLDELPQLWNVVRGEMSLVGPRPFPDYHLAKFSEEFRALRRTARPGITGLWQVTARSDADLRRQEEADTYYVRNWSLWLDLWVLLKTPGVVLSRKGAY